MDVITYFIVLALSFHTYNTISKFLFSTILMIIPFAKFEITK